MEDKGRKSEAHAAKPEEAMDGNPFARLLGKFPETAAPKADTAAPLKPVLRFRVGRTKKGGYPIFLEKRSGGKTMTIIRNVSGDADALLTLLKKRCAAGGKAFDDSVEVQGDHCERIQTLLRGLGL